MLTLRASLFLMALVFIVSACTTKTGPAEAYKGETPKQIFEAGESDMRQGDYTEAIKRFEALDVQYPLEPESEIAELHLIYAYYRKEEYPLAEAAAARFIRVHPMSQHTDYAYLIQGLADYYENQGVLDQMVGVDLAKRDLVPIKKAYFDFSAIVEKFPTSPYAPAAYQYMVFLRNILANHQLQLAQFYYDRKAYVASIDRADLVIKHYEGAPAVPQALVVMAKAYRGLHLSQQENAVLQLLQYNYPDSTYVREAR
jgi:outer membrane protein assembly factor BamD